MQRHSEEGHYEQLIPRNSQQSVFGVAFEQNINGDMRI